MSNGEVDCRAVSGHLPFLIALAPCLTYPHSQAYAQDQVKFKILQIMVVLLSNHNLCI